MEYSTLERDTLRRLAEEQAQIAALPIHRATIEGWKRLNRLEHGKPMVWINEVCWHEVNVKDELTVVCQDPFLRWAETELRRTIYQWRHLPDDRVVEPVFYLPLVIHDTLFGISEDVDVVRTDAASDVVSRHFNIQIRDERDLEKIKLPEVSYDATETARRCQILNEIFGDRLRVVSRGQPGFWFAPWDELVRWWGVEEAMRDLIDRPALVHTAMDRLVSAYLHRLDQYEQQGLLALNNTNLRVGSGGLGYSDQLPAPGFDASQVRSQDLWGCATAQIFSAISPRMHEEFALRHERRWLERFGLNYYGCCEPLDAKINILKSIPRLRKISMSPWINVERAIHNIGEQFVFSYKPSPAIFAEDHWNPVRARQALVDFLERARGCVVEIIMKDISTVRYQPQRLWEWAEMAREVTKL
jgi:hypothetical protein